jgi:GrpB-like predicted nucleotidyltransferase (UPF0157 family)
MMRHDATVHWLNDVGIGLDENTLRLERSTPDWVSAGQRLRNQVADRLGTTVAAVEQIGSSSVPGLLARPIVDLAVGITPSHDLADVHQILVGHGWIHRGDSGDSGGHVYVFELRTLHRVAHLHVVDHDGVQWRNYVAPRDTLLASPEARSRYESEKLRLQAEVGHDREAYTEGKTTVIRSLLTDPP